jgi:iron complex outermembrane receptor protein
VVIGSINDSARKIYFRNKGVYAQATYDITKQLSITGGIRYTWDKMKSISQDSRIAVPSLTRTCNDRVRFGTAVIASREQCTLILRAASKRPTWLIDVDYKPTDDILLYAKYARGYRQGGINPTAVLFEAWGPEKVDAYEIGAKTSFHTGSVRGYLNLAAFYNNFSDQQLNMNGIALTTPGPGFVAGFAGSQGVVNAGKSTIKGIEVDASAKFFRSFQLDLGYTYLKTLLKEITIPPVPVGGPYAAFLPTAVVGGPLALSPKHRLTLTGTYTLPVPESIGEIRLGATFVYTAKQAFTQATLPQFQTLPATSLLNLNVNWDNFLGQPFDLAFFMTNVTNKIYPTSVGSSWFSAGFEAESFGAPRMWGFRARYRFGT